MIELFFCLYYYGIKIGGGVHASIYWPPRQSCDRQCLQPKEDLEIPTCDLWLSHSYHRAGGRIIVLIFAVYSVLSTHILGVLVVS